MRDILERDVKAYLYRRVAECGGQIRKTKWEGRRGALDQLVLLPGRHWIAELKAPGKHLDDHQIREKVRLQLAAFDVYEIDSFEDVDALL